ncbi:adenylate/guanylate cyclase domain-containing protein [Nocardioides lentus]|uniref:Adenylate/guanylate cyclase domain-containing protein n=1 Tax=Nocardioides lentus TaxID=338077 RepID=A0ABP5A7D2_9ACTN
MPDGLGDVERLLLGSEPGLTRREVADRADVPVEVAEELWRRLGFPATADDDVAFVEADVEALRLARELTEMGVLDPDSQAALVRTWGRSFARLAEWQTALLARVATAGSDGGVPASSDADPMARLTALTDEVLPRVETLQSYVWRRHLASATARRLAQGSRDGGTATRLAVGFVDIVGYTATSRNLDESALVAWVEGFEDTATTVVVDHGGRVIKNIGDEVLYVADDPAAAAEIALALVERGAGDDDFPGVRAGVSYGEVVARLGDVFGETVNLAARLTSAARPGTVLVESGVHDLLCGDHDEGGDRDGADVEADGAGHAGGRDDPPYDLRRVRRASVKNYPGLRVWALRRPATRRR